MADEGFPHFRIPEELDRKFDEQINHLVSNSKYSFGMSESGNHFVL
jgi:hypothetical protein